MSARRMCSTLALMASVAAMAPMHSFAVDAEVKEEVGLGLPHDASLNGHVIDEVFHVGHWLDYALFAAMCLWLFIAVFRYGKNHQAKYDHGIARSQHVRTLVITMGIFLFVDVGFLMRTSIVGLDEVFWNWSIPKNNPETVHIEVNGHQWAWDLRYAGPDGKFSTSTAGSDDDVVLWNDMKIPIDTPIHLQLTSSDVIHSFYLPNFRQKVHVVPGQVNQMWFQAKELGSFEVGCTQHCGTNHYKMKAKLTVLTKDEYKKWLAEGVENGRRAYNPDDLAAHWGWEWKE